MSSASNFVEPKPKEVMTCEYLKWPITHRYGVPVAQKDDEPLSLHGTYSSIGAMIRHLNDRLGDKTCAPTYFFNVVRTMALLMETDQDKIKAWTELKLESKELESLKKLTLVRDWVKKWMAPSHKELNSFREADGTGAGKLSRADYEKADPTHGKFMELSQTLEEKIAQKQRTREKNLANHERKYGKEKDVARLFFFPADPAKDSTGRVDLCSQITVPALNQSDFLAEKKSVAILDLGKEGTRLVMHGGSCQNKVARNKFYQGSGVSDDKKQVLKGDCLIITFNSAMDTKEFMEIKEDWTYEKKQAPRKKKREDTNSDSDSDEEQKVTPPPPPPPSKKKEPATPTKPAKKPSKKKNKSSDEEVF